MVMLFKLISLAKKPGKGMDCVLNQVTDVNKVVGKAANKVSY